MGHYPEDKSDKAAARKFAERKAAAPAKPEKLAAPPPPDGGWGWAIVFASFMVHVITDGLTYSYGLFIPKIKEYFETNTEDASWVLALLTGVTFCSGPISSFLVNKFGCQAVTIAGSILASMCLLLGAWAPNLILVHLNAGIGTGLGFGLIYLPAIVSVTIYFEKYRSLATGIAVCGSGLGTVVFAPFIDFLFTYYGSYKRTMVVLAGVILNCIVFGIIFKPLEPACGSTTTTTAAAAEQVPLQVVQPERKNGAAAAVTLALPEQQLPGGKQMSLDRSQSLHQSAAKQYSAAGGLALNGEPGSNGIRLALSQPALAGSKVLEGSNHPHHHHHHQAFHRPNYGSGVMNRSDVFLRSSIHSIRKRSESLTHSEENLRLRVSLRSLPNGAGHHKGGENADGTECDELEDNIIKRMLKFSLLSDPLFIIFTVSNFCTSLGYNVPYGFLVGLSKERGITDESIATSLISIIGAANTVGRVVLGYVSDKPWVDRLLVYTLCLTTCGAATILGPYCYNYTLLAMYAVVYGFSTGAYVGLTSVCLVDIVGLDKLTNAFGLVLLSQGIASLAGTPMAGRLIDLYLVHDPAFYFGGLMILVSGLMLFAIPPIQRCQSRREERLRKADVGA